MKSSGGVFEIEDRGRLIYSKKKTGRFPGDREILDILEFENQGLNIDEARARAAEGIPEPPSFLEWLSGFLGRQKLKQ